MSNDFSDIPEERRREIEREILENDRSSPTQAGVIEGLFIDFYRKLGLESSRGSRKQLKKVFEKFPEATSELRALPYELVGLGTYDGKANHMNSVSRFLATTKNSLFLIRPVSNREGLAGIVQISFDDVVGLKSNLHHRGMTVRLRDGSTVDITVRNPTSMDGIDAVRHALGIAANGEADWREISRLRPQRVWNAQMIVLNHLVRMFVVEVDDADGIALRGVDKTEGSMSIHWSYLETSAWKEFSAIANTVMAVAPTKLGGREIARFNLDFDLAMGAQRFFAGTGPNAPLTQPDMKFANIHIEFIEDGWDLQLTNRGHGGSDYLKRAQPIVMNRANACLSERMWQVNGPRVEPGENGEILLAEESIPPYAPHLVEYERVMAEAANEQELIVETTRLQSGLKTCPDCAEEVKSAARKCRYCGYEFSPAE